MAKRQTGGQARGHLHLLHYRKVMPREDRGSQGVGTDDRCVCTGMCRVLLSIHQETHLKRTEP